ncbi:MAG: hypothetical protein ACE5OZ_17885 [Candidatus Heimdallarchaeota archaeon]
MASRKTISLIFASFALGILIAPLIDEMFSNSLERPLYGLSQQKADEIEEPEYQRARQEHLEETETLIAARESAMEVAFQLEEKDGIYENLNLFPESNTPIAIAYGIMGLARGYQLLNDEALKDRLVELTDRHADNTGFVDDDRGYGRNGQGLYYRDIWGFLVAESEINLWMTLALLEAFLATEDPAYLGEANRTFNALNATHWSGIYNGSISGYLPGLEIDPANGTVIPPGGTGMILELNLRDQILAMYCLRKLAYFSNPAQYAQKQAAIDKLESLVPSFESSPSNDSSFVGGDFPLYHSRADNYSGQLEAQTWTEIFGLDHVLLLGHFVGRGIQFALGSVGETTLQSTVAGRQILNGITFPANVTRSKAYLQNATDLRQTIEEKLTLESSGLISSQIILDFDAIDFYAETATNFLYVTILLEFAKVLSNETIANIAGPNKGQFIKPAYDLTATLFDRGIVNEHSPVFEGAISPGEDVFSDPGWVQASRIAANAWATIALANILPLNVKISSFRGIEINTAQNITTSLTVQPSASLIWSPSAVGEANFSIEGIRTSVDFQRGEEQPFFEFMTIWAQLSQPHFGKFNATKDEPGYELAVVKIDHLGEVFATFEIPYDVVGQASLVIQEPQDGWEILEGTENLQIQVTAQDWDGTSLSNAILTIWYQRETNPGDWFEQVVDPFASPQTVSLSNMDELDVGTHELIFFLEKDGYLPAEYVALLEVVEPSLLDRIRPLLQSEMAWWAGQILIALGVLWKFNTIVIRRIRGKITTCSQCGSITATAFPRCSACGHNWTDEGVGDLKTRLRDAITDAAGEVGIDVGQDE